MARRCMLDDVSPGQTRYYQPYIGPARDRTSEENPQSRNSHRDLSTEKTDEREDVDEN